ncbi:MAG: CoA pyrophosphatase [Phycisphaerae bacterium]|nr:CoA pyrophosphatase [Gemmatimonadaceae bacterium]
MTTERDSEVGDLLDVALRHPLVQKLHTRLSQLKPLDAHMYHGARLAAVMAVLRVVGDDASDVELLFIKRAVVARDPWSGHIAFPGGRHDAGDESLEHTAIRETREELAIDIGRYGRVLGRLDDLAPRSPHLPPILVRPFVAVIASSVPIVRNHEVADAFWVPVALLTSVSAGVQHEITVDGVSSQFPAYGVGGHVVWGLTERIVTQLLPLLGD